MNGELKELIVPTLAALSPVLFKKYAFPVLSSPFNAIVFGAFVGLASAYALMLLRETNVRVKAVLIGILVAELMLLEEAWHRTGIPPVPSILLFLFLYTHVTEKA